MTTKIDMSPQAITNRMIALDELWELTVALKNSKAVKDESAEPPTTEPDLKQKQNSEE